MNSTDKFLQGIDSASIREAEKLGYIVEEGHSMFFVRKKKGGKNYMLIYSGRIEMWQGIYADAKRICQKSGAMLLGMSIPSCTSLEHWTCQPWMADGHLNDWEIKRAKEFTGDRILKNYSRFFGRRWENVYFIKNEKK